MANDIDIAGLVEGGLLDLDEVFTTADWRRVGNIASYVSCCYGTDGDEPGDVDVSLETAEMYGITAYRWREHDGGSAYESGPIGLDSDAVIEDGETYAADMDECPDAEECIAAIVDSGYFGDADADDIRAICLTATQYTQGYLLLPAGRFCGAPIGRMWTTNGYLEGDHVRLMADHSSVAIAANALMREVASAVADE